MNAPRWKVLKAGESEEWPTPPALYEVLNREFHFTLDPCPLGGNEDGLSTLFKPWHGERVFCNPPYGPGLRKWLARALDADLAVFLIPARTDTRWFHEDCVPYAAEVRFIRGRLKFGNAEHAAPFASMLVIFEKPPIPGQMRIPVMKSMDVNAPGNSLAGVSHATAPPHIGCSSGCLPCLRSRGGTVARDTH